MSFSVFSRILQSRKDEAGDVPGSTPAVEIPDRASSSALGMKAGVAYERSLGTWTEAQLLSSELAKILSRLQEVHEADIGSLTSAGADVVRLRKLLDAETRIRERVEEALKVEQEQLAGVEAIRRNLVAEVGATKADLLALRAEFDSACAERDRMASDLKLATVQLRELTAERDSFMGANQQSQSLIAQKDDQITSLRDDLERAMAKVAETGAEASSLRGQVQDLTRQAQAIVTERNQLEDDLAATRAEFTAKIERDTQDIARLRKSVADLDGSLARVMRERDGLVQELADARNKNYGLMSRTTTVEKLLASAREKFFAAAEELRRTRGKNREIERENAALLLQIERQGKDLAAVQDENRQVIADSLSLRTTLAETVARVASQTETIAGLESELQSSNAALAQSRSRAEDREREMTLRLADADIRIRNLEAERSVLEGRLSVAREGRAADEARPTGLREGGADVIPLKSISAAE